LVSIAATAVANPGRGAYFGLMKLGRLEVHILNESTFWLDGGQMFGLVPRVFWEKDAPPDPTNRVPLGVHPVLVRSGDTWALLDAGNGDKFDDKFRKIYRVEEDAPVLRELARFGLRPDDIGLVVLSHLHFDHAGGASRREGARVVRAFPSARIVIDRAEWHDAWNPVEYTRGGYKRYDFECFEGAAEWLNPVEDAELLPGVHLLRAPGHTAHHRCMLLRSEGQGLLCTVDLIPQTHHVKLPWIAGLDHYPLVSLETKRRFLRQAVEENWWLCFSHQPGGAALGRVRAHEGAWALDGPLRESLG
jgi:glyoxylase-like metal-dependent hydrolase (beta-lactamase superfamily II)